MKSSPLTKVRQFRQSIWLDFISRGMLQSGELQSFIDDDGILGMTSNPSIFEKAIAESHDYDAAIQAGAIKGKTAQEIYEMIAVSDIQTAADLFRPTFEREKGLDGFVSLEVSPHLANDAAGTITEARHLWKTVSRSNVLIKVPATAAGLIAIKQLISEGINVNVTLLFSLMRYDQVVEAFISGLEKRGQDGNSLNGISSVASFFLSRIDIEVDRSLPTGSALKGKTAIASEKLAYQQFKKVFHGDRFKRLENLGATPQRLLWASTSTKNSHDSDVKFVDALIGAETINTVPIKTLNAYRDHGLPSASLEEGLTSAENEIESLSKIGVDLRKAMQTLEDEGVKKFGLAFDKLMTSIELKRVAAVKGMKASRLVTFVNCGDEVDVRVARLTEERFVKRIWEGDATLWKSEAAEQAQIKNSLGWLHIGEKMENNLDEIDDFVGEIRKAGFAHVVHMGMGGSSLAPLVFARTFASVGGLSLHILDSTVPESIQAIEKLIVVEKTLFIVATKSGTTAEPIAFKDYFFEKVKDIKGANAGENFVAITDAGTPMDRMAQEQKFRRIFRNAKDIGGRYSALSYFGIIPAALSGVDVAEVLNRASLAAHSSSANSIDSESPGLLLGAALGQMALRGKNKVTLIVDDQISTLGLWLEQLMAESTGKEGKGLIPIADESLGAPESYGEDRLFVHIKLKTSSTTCELRATEQKISVLEKSGCAVVRIGLADKFDLGRAFFLWEFATAVAGSILGINAFNQPNVQESKDNTNRLLAETPAQRRKEKPRHSEGCLSVYSTVDGTSMKDCLSQFIQLVLPGDYVALLAFLPESPEVTAKLQSIRTHLRDKLKLATTIGYGPRFLHSTGQLHKGGPASGVFMQLTANDSTDLAIPERPYSFDYFKQAEAEGDLEALRAHGRRVVRINLGHDLLEGLSQLERLMKSVMDAIEQANENEIPYNCVLSTELI